MSKHFTKRRVVIAAVVCAFLMLYVPVIRCFDDVKVGPKTCKELDLDPERCVTTEYYSVFTLLVNGHLSEICPAGKLHILFLTDAAFAIILISLAIAFLVDVLYSRYRDV
jgi:hypothetical protein